MMGTNGKRKALDKDRVRTKGGVGKALRGGLRGWLRRTGK